MQDLYIERFNDSGEYQTPSGWIRPETRREVIRVKGRLDVILDVEITRHGPIITPVLKDEKRKIALRWIANEPIGQEFPFFEINSAQQLAGTPGGFVEVRGACHEPGLCRYRGKHRIPGLRPDPDPGGR